MGQFVMCPPVKRRFSEAEQVVVAVGEKADAFFSRRGAVEVDQIIAAGHEKAGENAHVEIGARGRVAVGKLGPAEIAFVF
jgi:hypothetical protein